VAVIPPAKPMPHVLFDFAVEPLVFDQQQVFAVAVALHA
jgi:hypothetical protein